MNEIEIRKKISSINKECRAKAKLDKCLICQKKVTSFCNSHSVPKFVLKNIEDRGSVYTSNHFFELPIEKEEKGLLEAGTFHIICKECDSSIFRDYEDEIALLKEPTNRIMAEMALKNTLITIDKRNFEIQLYEKLRKEYSYLPEITEYFIQKNEVNKLDLEELNWECKRNKKIIDKDLKSGYKQMFWTMLDYICPLLHKVTFVCIQT